MNSTDTTEAILRNAFEDMALLIAGVAEARHFDDTLVWGLMRRLDRVRVRTLDRLHQVQDSKERNGSAPWRPSQLHPAVEAFLARNHRTRSEERAMDQTSPSRRKEPKPCHS